MNTLNIKNKWKLEVSGVLYSHTYFYLETSSKERLRTIILQH